MTPESTINLHSGINMPVVGFGTWQCTDNTSGTVTRALKHGYRMIDTSGDYGTQPGVDAGIKQSGIDRKSVYIITKVEENEDARKATRKNLDELGLDYVDLMLIHRPPSSGAGEELWEGLRRARDEGLAKDIGVSNYSIKKIRALIDASGETPAVNQVEWTPFGHSEDMFEFCQDQNIVIQAYSPLTRGERLNDKSLEDIALKHNKTPAQVLLRWNLQMGTVPLPKANKLEHLEQNLDIFDFDLNDDEMATLNGLNEEYSVLGHKLKYME